MKLRLPISKSCALALSCTAALAQPVLLPAHLDQQVRFGADVSYTFPSSIHIGSTDLGEIDSWHWHGSATWLGRASASYTWQIGVDLQQFSFNVPEGAPLPENLYGLALRLGNRWQFRENWAWQTQISPGVYSDLEDVSGGDFNAPFLTFLEYSIRPTLQLYAGVQVDVRRDTPVIPALGARWRFAPDWTLLMVYPIPRIEYRVNEQWTAYAGIEFRGTGFRVAEDFGTRVGRPELNDQDVSYREWRAAGGARWRVAEGWSVFAEGGWTIDRRFHFDDAELLANGDGAPFVQVGVSASF
jgi:hypothetical protein